MSTTKIQWTDRVWNPVRGCSRVSAGCDNCYAMGQAHRFSGPSLPYEGLTTIRRGKVDWAGQARFVPEMLSQPLRWRKPQRVFVNSMSDLFHESLSFEDIDRVFAIMARCPHITFQVLTKRAKRMAEYFADMEGRSVFWEETEELRDAQDDVDGFDDLKTEGDLRRTRQNEEALSNVAKFYSGTPLPNVHLGVSVEDQKTADERIPLLLQVPAAILWVSAEPLLGPVDLARYFEPTQAGSCLNCGRSTVSFIDITEGQWSEHGDLTCPECGHASGAESMGIDGIDWVVVGGESGPGARPCNVEWIRSIVKQCENASAPCFVKQLGPRPFEQVPHLIGGYGDGPLDLSTKPVPEGWTLVRTKDEAFLSRCYRLKHKKGGDPDEWPEDLRVRQFPVVEAER